ncbi:MAG: ABC transporter ATP-binding protein, partial [Candidatus Atribacteria bacterium]|nr:ABC transporter ATP-binding protein [Candidatus Atribacteria bacterium]
MKKEKLSSETDKKIFYKLSQYAKPYLGKIVILFFLVLAVSIIQICLPVITKNVIDNYIDRSHLRLTNNQEAREITDNYKSYRIAADKYIFIPSNILSRDDYSNLQRKDIIFPEKYFLFKDEKDFTILKEYQLQSIITDKGLFVPYSGINKISKDNLKVLRKNDLSKVKLFALIYIGLLLFSFIFNYFQVIMMAVVSEKMMYDLRSNLIRHIMSLSMNFFNHNPVGKLVTRMTNDVDALREMFSEVLVYSIKDIITIAGIFFVMFRLSARLSLVMLSLIPIISIMLYVFQKYAREAYTKVRIALAKINSFLAESISGISLIQTFNQEGKSWRDFKKTGVDY